MDKNVTQKEGNKANRKWNWGAFALPFPFGVINQVNKCYFSLIPVFGIIWTVVCGLKGTTWAFESGQFSSVKEFNDSMDRWNRAGIATCISTAATIVSCGIIILLLQALGNLTWSDVLSFMMRNA